MIKVIYEGLDKIKIQAEVLKAYNYVNNIFLIKIGDITVFVAQDRKEFDKQFGEKTTGWLVGNAIGKNKINILSPLAMKNESSHSPKEFLSILKHEFTHLFLSNLSAERAIPNWLNEGLAAYVAKQHQNGKDNIFIEDNFCKRLSSSRDWNNNVHHGAYLLSALFVKFLIKKYSFKKIEKLVSSLNKYYYQPDFEQIFLKIYGCEIDVVEKLFIQEINK